MSTNVASEEEGSSQIKRNNDDWKYPKIHIDQVYKKKIINISPTYAVKDYEDTITVNGKDHNVSGSLLTEYFLKGFKKQHRFVHLGLVQIAIKPLMRDGIGAPIVVSLRDARHLDFHNSLLALVKAHLSQGPFYFNCFPSFSVSLDDASLFDVLTIDVETGVIPLALTYRIVCKAMVDLSPEALKGPILGETAYFYPATRTQGTTKWDESQIHESTTSIQEPKAKEESSVHRLQDTCLLNKGKTISSNFANEEGSFRNRRRLDDWKYHKIPVKQVYNRNDHSMMLASESFKGPSLWSKAKKAFGPKTIKDYENTITLDNNQIDVSLDVLEGFIKKQNKGYVHLGFVQIAIKPQLTDGLEAPIIVCLRDVRFINLRKSIYALVQANLSQGPLYFNCRPGYALPLSEISDFLILHVVSRVPLVLTYRVVCNVTSEITLDHENSFVRGATTYYQASSGTESTTTKWDEVQLLESWAQM